MITSILYILLYITPLVLGVATASHALLNKRDPRSALAWIAACIFIPVIGAFLYMVFGLNRVRTRARTLGMRSLPMDLAQPMIRASHDRAQALGVAADFVPLECLAATVSGQRLTQANDLNLLTQARCAYDEMLAAIEQAQQQVYLASYIFDAKGVGQEFIDALVAAKLRGLEVKVLVDGIGRFYSWPQPFKPLQACGVEVALFLPPTLRPLRVAINMRNHRKLLVVDEQIAFTGGMNIRAAYCPESKKPQKEIKDLQVKLQGPIVAQLASSFLQDWAFTQGEEYIAKSLPEDSAPGHSLCRMLEDGPNYLLDNLIKVMVTAIASAKHSVTIVSPYFLPPRELAVALQTAALRGVEVRVVLPDENNLPFVDWAAQHMLYPLLRAGVQVERYQQGFLHSKLYLVDDYYALLGSANMDPRSLRLNFELMVEVYDAQLGRQLQQYVASLLAQSRPMTMTQLASRPVWRKYRDAICWLFSPYL